MRDTLPVIMPLCASVINGEKQKNIINQGKRIFKKRVIFFEDANKRVRNEYQMKNLISF